MVVKQQQEHADECFFCDLACFPAQTQLCGRAICQVVWITCSTVVWYFDICWTRSFVNIQASDVHG